jgi:hypothetical protein
LVYSNFDAEIDEYSRYLAGEVLEYTLEDTEAEDSWVDSCGGIYEDDVDHLLPKELLSLEWDYRELQYHPAYYA